MKIFVTGIGTEIGKTISSAILVEALEADYWKPIQAGELKFSDTDKVKTLISNENSQFHPEGYRLKAAMSPHAAAKKEGVEIKIDNCHEPHTENTLIIEGAGGLAVPLNDTDCIIDLIAHLKAETILISQHYLGSINHTLLSVEALEKRGLPIKGIIFNGDENKATEDIILSKTGLDFLGRIPNMNTIDKDSIQSMAQHFKHLKS
ncbi:dethiobiotin synthase [Flavobacteriales bacterium]|jgi:dethiobiotin synthetase|nr:dethiobiotin synthase [Flavobacteriales bacterium]